MNKEKVQRNTKSNAIEKGKVIKDRWEILEKLGHGSHGVVYKAYDREGKIDVAVKTEPINNPHKILVKECEIYDQILKCHSHDKTGIPKLYHFCRFENHYILVIELLGPSLHDLFSYQGKVLSTKTILLIFMGLLRCIENLHSLGIVHRDIKPDNICMGNGKNASVVYLIDFGISKIYLDLETENHISFSKGRKFIGTRRYASLAAHKGKEQSRKDDLEAIGYTMMHLFNGKLPWDNSDKTLVQERKDIVRDIYNWKKQPADAFCQEKKHPKMFVRYLTNVKAIKFSYQPNYNGLRNIFQAALDKWGFLEDGYFDWAYSDNCEKLPLEKLDDRFENVRKLLRTPTSSNKISDTQSSTRQIPESENSTKGRSDYLRKTVGDENKTAPGILRAPNSMDSKMFHSASVGEPNRTSFERRHSIGDEERRKEEESENVEKKKKSTFRRFLKKMFA